MNQAHICKLYQYTHSMSHKPKKKKTMNLITLELPPREIDREIYGVGFESHWYPLDLICLRREADCSAKTTLRNLLVLDPVRTEPWSWALFKFLINLCTKKKGFESHQKQDGNADQDDMCNVLARNYCKACEMHSTLKLIIMEKKNLVPPTTYVPLSATAYIRKEYFFCIPY